jgi:lipopolysaccharide transport system ATP-binding protein
MTVRLAFAVAAFLEPEILVIDEVLAVGDAEFQKKAIGKMQEISLQGGRTVLFVSHNMAAVRSLCTRGIVLEYGKVVMEGDIDKVLNFYLKSNQNRNRWEGEDGDSSMRLLKVEVFNVNENEIFKNTDPIQILMKFEIGENFNDIVIGVNIYSAIGNPLVGLLYNDYNDYNEIKSGIYEVLFTIPPCSLASGDYELEFNLSIPYVKRFTTGKSNLSFSITADTAYGNRFFVQNNSFLNSLIRPNWFESINKIKL